MDLLVNNAGLMTGGLLEEQDVDEIYAMFQVNLVAVVHLTSLLLPAMLERGRGKIVNNASISGYAWFPAASTYAAAKTGVVAFSESLRRELKGTGVESCTSSPPASTPTCSTRPGRSMAATWKPPPGTTSLRRSGRRRWFARSNATITCSGPAAGSRSPSSPLVARGARPHL